MMIDGLIADDGGSSLISLANRNTNLMMVETVPVRWIVLDGLGKKYKTHAGSSGVSRIIYKFGYTQWALSGAKKLIEPY